MYWFNFHAILCTFSRSLTTSEILVGILWGCMVLVDPLYASQVAQIKLRGVLTAMTNLSFVTGQFAANFISDAFFLNSAEWTYTVPFAIQWAWPVIILSLLPFAAAPPYWLIVIVKSRS